MSIIAAVMLIAIISTGDIQHQDMELIRPHLIETVHYLSDDIGQRSFLDLKKLNRVADYIEEKFNSFGCIVRRQAFTYRDNTYYNIIAEVKGKFDTEDGIIVVGAHYDTVVGTPGADDNASGVAVLLELARLTAKKPLRKTIHFAAFCLEEPPVFMTKKMGSHAYAKSLRQNDIPVHGMISLEMLGYYCEQKGCQFYPLPFFRWIYPDKGNFIAFVGNLSSRSFTLRMKKAFQAVSTLPVESLNSVSIIPGVDFSDHRSFWKFGYPAFMITDTAFYRNENYHSPGDTAETLDYGKMTELVAGLYRAFNRLK